MNPGHRLIPPDKTSRLLLQIKSHQFVRNDAIAATIGLPSISEAISRRRYSLFGHVARLPDDVPAHKALNCQVKLSLGRPPSSQWHRSPGRPRSRWVDQIRNDSSLTTCGPLEARYGPPG